MRAHEKNETEVNPQAILSMLVERGIVGENTIKDVKQRGEAQQQNRIAYHNTKLLLKHYRTIAWMLECFPDAIANELELPFEHIDDIIDHLDIELAYGNKKLEEKLASVQKTRQLVDRVNDALTVLKKKPGDGERLYELVYLSYIAPEGMTHNELLFRLNISSRQYYRMREQALSILSLRLWSALSKESELWFEILTFLDEIS